MAKRKRPVYVVLKRTGILDEDGEELMAHVDVKGTRVEADDLANSIEGAIVRKGQLMTM